VLAMSARPGSIILDMPVDLPRPRRGEMRYSDTFSDLTHTLRDTLHLVNGLVK